MTYEERVEAAAKAFLNNDTPKLWDQVDEGVRDVYRGWTRAALEAAGLKDLVEALDVLSRWHGVVASQVPGRFDLPATLVDDLRGRGGSSSLIELSVRKTVDAALNPTEGDKR